MKQLIKLSINKTLFASSLKAQSNLIRNKSEAKHFSNSCSLLSKNSYSYSFQFAVKYFMSSSASGGGMKFKSKFSKKHSNNNKQHTAQTQNFDSTGDHPAKSQKVHSQNHLESLTEQYLRQLRQSQGLNDQFQTGCDFSLQIIEKPTLAKIQAINEQEIIQESFNWMQRLVYEQQKKINKQDQTNKSNINSTTVKAIQLKSETDIEKEALVARKFDLDLPKNILIQNSRKFLQYSCHLFNQYQLLRIMNQIKQYIRKVDSVQFTQVPANETRRTQVGKVKNQTKRIRLQLQRQQLKFFKSMRRLFYESVADPGLVNKMLILLSKSDPRILKIQDIQKFIYKHQERVIMKNQKHKAELQIIFRNLPNFLQNNQASHATIQQINKTISSKIQFLEEVEHINSNKQPFIANKQSIEEEQDLVNVFQEFSKPQKSTNKKNIFNQGVQPMSRQRQFKLHVKKPLQQNHQQFQIKQSSLNEIDRVLFKNTKIVQDKIILQKQKKNTKNMTAKQKQEEQEKIKFGQNWVYAYELPYSLSLQQAQNIIDFITKKSGQITEFYIYPYKNFLQKKENESIHIQIIRGQEKLAQKNISFEQKKIIKKQLMTDKLLQKINREKFLKLNKTSMVFKFKNLQEKNIFLSKELRLFGLNLSNFRNIRFQEAQSKTILALSMVPWGCSSTDLVNAINSQLKPLNVQVSYQKCIIAKGYIFIQFDSFYQTLKSRDLLNNLVFQNQRLKAQINYGSSKVYSQKFKSSLQFDHYESLIGKLKEINCFYNQLYQ